MSQISIPLEVRPEEVARKHSLGAAIELCADIAGFGLEKTARDEFEKRGLPIDKAQFSRWKDGSEGVVWPKLSKLMDICGNDAPLLWMLHQRGYELTSLRRRETELERDLRNARERIDQLERERDVERRLLRDLRAVA